MKTTPHILVIDDENHICESCDRIFSNAGYKVDTNINATGGFRQALMNPYDAIILDLNLVESDGMKLLYGIRKKKPDVPVVIITGYPSEDTRRKSTTLGVIDYITKPFEPAEILEPVQKVIAGESKTRKEPKTAVKNEIRELQYHFYFSAWFYQMNNGKVRVGCYLPNLSNNYIKYVNLPNLGNQIYRGLPLAEVGLSDGSKHIIPSAITGKVIVINSNLREHYYNLEKNIHKKSWIALVEPESLETDIKATQIRNVLVFSDEDNVDNEFYHRIIHNGYNTRVSDNLEEVLRILSMGEIGVLIMDARLFGDSGPGYIKRINREFPEAKIIVFNDPDLRIEKIYRKYNLFYYGVNPILNNEMTDLLHCVFTEDCQKINLKNPNVSGFLPNTINKISITNRNGMKVVLFAYDGLLQHSGGLGYLLTKDLLDMELPVTIAHTRYPKTIDSLTEIQKIETEKEKNDRIIILQAKYLNKIPCSITKDIQEYTNEKSALNVLINFSIQPASESGKVEFEANQIATLKDLIINEMISK